MKGRPPRHKPSGARLNGGSASNREYKIRLLWYTIWIVVRELRRMAHYENASVVQKQCHLFFQSS